MRIHVVSLSAACLVAARAVAAQSLDFDEALRLAHEHSARLVAQRHSVAAAAEQVERARELPDPRLRVGIENLPSTGPNEYRYDRDFMSARTIGWMQEFPNEAKRHARGSRARQARDVERAQLAALGVRLRRDVAAAWLDVHFAERTRAALEQLAERFRLQIAAAPSGIVRGRMGAAESYALRLAQEQVNDRAIDAGRALARARIALAQWVGDAATRPLGLGPDPSRLPVPREALLEQHMTHAPQRLFGEREALARAEVDLARAARQPDWSLEVGFAQRRPEFQNMVSVMLAFELPMHAERRQDRDIASRLAELERARAEREDARRAYEAQLRGWLADFDSASERVARYHRMLMPLARERREAALAAYRAARGELAAVLEAERGLTELELGLVQAEAERARAWAALSYLDAQEESR